MKGLGAERECAQEDLREEFRNFKDDNNVAQQKTLEKSDMPRKLCVTSYKGSKSVVVIIKKYPYHSDAFLFLHVSLFAHIASSSYRSPFFCHHTLISQTPRKSVRLRKTRKMRRTYRNKRSARVHEVKMEIVFRL